MHMEAWHKAGRSSAAADAKEHTVNRSARKIGIMALLPAIVGFLGPGDAMARLHARAGSPPGAEPKAQAAAPADSRKADTILVNGAILVFHGIERNDGAGPPKFEQAVA